MNKIYQVFVSSTYEDLQEERKEVMQALLELDCMPAGMELFPASNDDQWTLIKRVIDTCDYYLLIIGGRYGSTNTEGISYTQMEFEYALQTGKPIISFLPKTPEDIPSGKCDQDPEKREKLENFKKLAKKKLVKFWSTPENLGSIVSRSMIKLIKDFPAEGWVKSNTIDDNSMKEIVKLQKENEELKAKLNRISTEPPKGSEQLMQGDDEITFHLCFEANRKRSLTPYKCADFVNTTWNHIFERIAPLMIDECTESTLKNALDSFAATFKKDFSNDPCYKNMCDFRNFRVSSETFNQIKVQLRALGLIEISSKKHSTTDKSTYWSLTQYGDFAMTQLLALKKED
ncbi:DUF4062 domain-containing protein [Gemmiger formicilis]|uniref:DUF4062 domain-containing protein n=1 Tax=Gemmiger formicilis TaxID=745368 RepID=UPI00195DFE05|nr:DUF4062 domain-containing protein [Gemmiger formicilis]MBM6900563.1 DUF4062 domain-containing protein [Gemmiger formicilis]